MDLKQIINDVHQNSLDHGWWDDYQELMIQLRWAKAYHKNDRKNKYFKSIYNFWENLRLNWIAAKLALIHSEVSEWEEAVDEDNFIEELADVCIRIFDLIGGLEINVTQMMRYNSWCISDKSIHWHITQALECLRKNQEMGFENALFSVYLKCSFVASAYAVNLEEAIKKKMEYNKTRPYKHGGKKL